MIYSHYKKYADNLLINKDFVKQMAKQTIEDEETKKIFEDVANDDIYTRLVIGYAVIKTVFFTLILYGIICLFVFLFFPLLTILSKFLAALLILLIFDVITEIMNLLMRRQ